MDRVCVFPFPASKGKVSKKRLRGHSQSKGAGGKERERDSSSSRMEELSLKKNPALGGHQQHERGRDGKKLIGRVLWSGIHRRVHAKWVSHPESMECGGQCGINAIIKDTVSPHPFDEADSRHTGPVAMASPWRQTAHAQ